MGPPCVNTTAGWRAADIRTVARETEEAGYEALFATEVNNDVLAAAQLMGEVTRTLKVGSWVANIYLRHAYLCAKHAALIADATDGRLILGLGVSHAPINQVLGINMPSAVDALRNYVKEVTGWLKGEGPATHLPQEPATHHVPVQIGALSSSSVELAGEIADGVMPFLWSPERVRKSKKWSDRGRAKSCEQNPFEVSLGIPIFIGDDMTALMGAARANLGLYAGLPFFQRLLRVSGFEKDAVKAEQGGGGDALSLVLAEDGVGRAPRALGAVLLFDAVNGDEELARVLAFLDGALRRDAAALASCSDAAAQLGYLEGSTRFVAVTTGR